MAGELEELRVEDLRGDELLVSAPGVLGIGDAAAHRGRRIAEEIGELERQEETEERRHRSEHDEPLLDAQASDRRPRRGRCGRHGAGAQAHPTRSDRTRQDGDEEDQPRAEIDALDELDHRVTRGGQDGVGTRQQEPEHRDHGQGHRPAANGRPPPRARERAQQLEATPGGFDQRDHGRDGGQPRDEWHVEPARGRIAGHDHGGRQEDQPTADDENAEDGIGGERSARAEGAGEAERRPDRRGRPPLGEPGAEGEPRRRQRHPERPVETERGVEEDPGAEGGYREGPDPERQECGHRAALLAGPASAPGSEPKRRSRVWK